MLGLEGPSRVITWFPKARTPLPRSHNTCSSSPASSCTQAELPPNVCETAKSRSESTQARAFSCVSRRLPEAATIAWASLSLIDAESRETGMEPRVPQNVTHSAIGQVPWAESYAARAVGEALVSASRTDLKHWSARLNRLDAEAS